MNRNLIIAAVLVLVIAVAAFIYNALKPKRSESGSITNQQVSENPPQTQTNVETATLAAVGNYSGSATATRSFDGETFTHTVTAAISDPAVGKFYEGWLVDKQPTLRFFSTGKITRDGNQYVLIYTDSLNYPDYNDVVITEETEADGLDGKPETHVLEGSF